MNIAELWDNQVRTYWSKNYHIELSELLKENGVKSILDTSGGTGYPSIEFAQMGWDISYADSSLEMYEFFNKKLKEKKLIVPSFLVKWQNLNSKIDKKYDALLCRGNSFIYIDGYDIKTYNPRIIKENMQRSLVQFYNQLNLNGVLYIDLLKEEHKTQSVKKDENFKTYCSSTKVSYNEITNVRTITESIKFFDNDTLYNFTMYSYVITEQELKSMLYDAGFISVNKIEIDSSDIADSFLAKK